VSNIIHFVAQVNAQLVHEMWNS